MINLLPIDLHDILLALLLLVNIKIMLQDKTSLNAFKRHTARFKRRTRRLFKKITHKLKKEG